MYDDDGWQDDGDEVKTAPNKGSAVMQFSAQQQDALNQIRDWHSRAVNGDAPQIFRLFGYAGTGKTTIAKALQDMGKVQYAALTGKAALVLRGKGCANAKTIHSMIYRSMDKNKEERDEAKRQLAAIENDPSKATEAAELIRRIAEMNEELKSPSFSLNPNAFTREWDDDAKEYTYIQPPVLLAIDECSMVDKKVGQDIESFGIPILVLGDPMQLPPVNSAGYFTGSKDYPVKPDVLLTEIHRQAQDNPILKIATAIRTRAMPPVGEYGDSRIVERNGLTPEEWLAADQILSGRIVTKNKINARIRERRGYSGILPEQGERLVCLRNNHKLGLLNGSMWEVVEVADCPKEIYFTLTIRSLDEERDEVKTFAHKKPFLGQEFEDSYERKEADEFDFGYCITTHKAQGSEWSNVIYIDEWPSQDRIRHQYTGVTRARDRITIVKW